DVSATQRALGRNTAGAGVVEEVTASQLLDWIGATQGQILFRGASLWSVLATGTAGQLLQTGGAAANPSWVNAPAASPWTTINKTADQSITSSTTMTNDNAFSFSFSASTKYSMRMRVFVNSLTDINNNFKCQFTGPAAATLVRVRMNGIVSNSGTP